MVHVTRRKGILIIVFEKTVKGESGRETKRLTMTEDVKRGRYKATEEQAWDRSNRGRQSAECALIPHGLLLKV